MITHRYGKVHCLLHRFILLGEGEQSIIYLDADNLYSLRMTQPLPYGGFRWPDKENICPLDVTHAEDNAEKGSPPGFS